MFVDFAYSILLFGLRILFPIPLMKPNCSNPLRRILKRDIKKGARERLFFLIENISLHNKKVRHRKHLRFGKRFIPSLGDGIRAYI